MCAAGQGIPGRQQEAQTPGGTSRLKAEPAARAGPGGRERRAGAWFPGLAGRKGRGLVLISPRPLRGPGTSATHSQVESVASLRKQRQLQAQGPEDDQWQNQA